MKRIALRSTAALLSIAALGSTASAQSGYMVSSGKTDAAPTAEAKDAKTERASSGYAITWGKSAE